MAAIAGTSAIYLENVVFNNKFQLDAEEVEHTETFTSPDDWVPCEETPKTVVTTNKSNHPVKVRLNYDEWWRNQTDTENLPVEQDGHRLTTINFQNEDDWELSGNWYYWKGELAPGESTRSLFKSVTFDCSANFAVQHICTDQGCTDVHSPYEGADYHILITVQTTDEDFPHDETFSVSIDPNGGEFNGSTDVYTDTVQYGTVIDLSNINYTDHELVDWTKNGSESYTDNRIRIINDTTLVANWQSSIFHTITVNPNGGSLDGNTEPIETNVRQGESFTLTNSIPTLEGYVFNHWDIKVGDGETAPISDYTFTVSDDVTITATYDKAIAKNTRTNKEYASITAAISDNTLQAGDTILLLADTEETVTIPEGKDFTLDLGEFIVTGSIANNGTLTLLNGEINNPDGAAFINNGTLTMGVNDYLDEAQQQVNIQDDYVRLIGTTTGLKQNGAFNYYDGYIEGDVALEGGYNAAPSYRNTFDGVVVYYFPLVDFNNVKQLQHVSLASSDNAVSKTTVNGDIYYYNLQDNINTSIRTGYKIYIVRDFDAGYTITSPADTDVTIDLAGYDISLNDTITINGKLTIEDSTTTVETVDNGDGVDGDLLMPSISGNVAITPHKTTTTTVTYGGKISVPQTIINNNELVLKNVFITGVTTNDTIRNNANLVMQNSILSATTGYTMQPIAGAIQDMDANSYIASTVTNKPAVYNTLDELIWSSGNIYGQSTGITNPSGKTLKHTGGIIYGSTGISNSGTLIVEGGTVKASSTGISGSATINSGAITVEAAGKATGINGATTLNGGLISVSSSGNEAYGINGGGTINGGTINVENSATSGRAYTVYGIWHSAGGKGIEINDGVINANNTLGQAIGVYEGYYQGYGYCNDGLAYINGGTITSHSVSSDSFGGYGAICGSRLQGGNFIINDGLITANSDQATAYGVNAPINSIFGGRIIGGDYGVYTSRETTVTIGENDGNINIASPEIAGGKYGLYGGAVNFYDGVLKGNVEAYQEGTIKAIPDATTYHIESSADYDKNCWLEDAENYLEVNGVSYNSLKKAYDAITGNSGTIKVISNALVEAVLPESPAGKEITLDLNGYHLTYTQPLINNSDMVIVDSSENKTGLLSNSNTNATTIINNANLAISSGHITSVNTTISNTKGSVLTLNGGTIESTYIGVYSAGRDGQTDGKTNTATININGGLITTSNSGTSSQFCLYNESWTVTNINGGEIKNIREGEVDSASIIGIYINYGNSAIVNIDAENQTPINISNSNGSATGVSGTNVNLIKGNISTISKNNSATGVSLTTSGSATINSGAITVEAAGKATGINGATTLNGGLISVSSSGNEAYGINGGGTINGGTINVENSATSGRAYTVYGIWHSAGGKGIEINDGVINANNTLGQAIGVYEGYYQGYGYCNDGLAYINGGTITSHSVSSDSFGGYGAICGSRLQGGNFIINDGLITANSDQATAYGVNAPINSIFGGRIIGGDYGVYTSRETTVTIGENDGNINIASPEIAGGKYGLYGGAVNFYDGVLKGGIEAYDDGTVKAVADNYTIYIGTEEIIKDGTTYIYDVRYLTPEHVVAKIGDSGYTKLSDAIDNSNENDVIKLIDDNYLFYSLIISQEKKITIDTNGYDIITGNPITNNGDVVIKNTSYESSNPVFDYNGSGYYITNNEGGTLKLENITIRANYILDNRGSLNLNNSSFDSLNISINNTGNITGDENSLSGSEYAIYNNGGESSLTGISANGVIYINAGKLSLTGGTITKTGEEVENMVYVSTSCELSLSNIDARFSASNYSSTSSTARNRYSNAFYNNGSIFADGVNLTYTLMDKTNINIRALYNAGRASLIDTHVSIITSENTSATNSNIAILNTSEDFLFASGSIITTDNSAYGIYNDAGVVTLGVPEDPSSQDYGRATADVSTTNPDIRAIGTSSGIGVKNANGGKVYYYDGKITGSTAAMPENPAGLEYMYEPKDYTDENGYQFRILEWMREQPGN